MQGEGWSAVLARRLGAAVGGVFCGRAAKRGGCGARYAARCDAARCDAAARRGAHIELKVVPVFSLRRRCSSSTVIMLSALASLYALAPSNFLAPSTMTWLGVGLGLGLGFGFGLG